VTALTRESLLAVLADGREHSGEDLARTFGVSRAAVWKQIGKLADWQLEIEAAPGKGYRLARPLELLDAADLRRRIAGRTGPVRLELHTEIESTNGRLLARPPPPGTLAVCIAEYQTAGRGRRGRRWSAPFGTALCLSASWQFERTPPELAALTLAVGVVVRDVLARTVRVDARLKWPNDLVWDERKLGGILLELIAEAQGGCHVVIGVGLNVAMPPALLRRLSDWPRGAVDLATATGAVPSRAALAAELVVGLDALCRDYAATGFTPYRAAWRAADFLRGRSVTLHEPAGEIAATALGIEADGALLVETAGGARKRVLAGDVSVRAP